MLPLSIRDDAIFQARTGETIAISFARVIGFYANVTKALE